jgi:SAM-dependent methyltransferase
MPEVAFGRRLALLARHWGLLAPPLAWSRRWLTRLLLQGPGVRTLDLGCGDGYYTLAAARRGESAVGLSNDPEGLRRASETRDLLRLTTEQADFRCEDLRTWRPSPEEQYDQVLLLAVLEHLLDDAGLLQRVHTALKPNGLLFACTPNRACGLRDGRAHITRDEVGRHVRHGYTFEQLEAILGRCGYEAVDRRGFAWLGTQTMARLQHALPLPSSAVAILRVLLLPVWRPLALLLDLLPTDEPYLILVIARKAAPA